jgi:hypothetical protein
MALFFSGSLAGLLFATVRRLRSSQQAALALIGLLGFAGLASTGADQLADVPAACYFLSSAAMLVLYFDTRGTSLPVMAGLAAGLGAWTKDEGLPFLAIASLVWIVMGASRHKELLGRFALGASGPTLLVLLHKAFLAPRSEILIGIDQRLGLMIDPARYAQILPKVLASLLGPETGLAIPLAALILYAVLMGRSPDGVGGLRLLGLMVVLQMAVYVSVYLLTPFDPDLLISTSSARLYLQLHPIILLAIFLWLRSPEVMPSRSG